MVVSFDEKTKPESELEKWLHTNFTFKNNLIIYMYGNEDFTDLPEDSNYEGYCKNKKYYKNPRTALITILLNIGMNTAVKEIAENFKKISKQKNEEIHLSSDLNKMLDRTLEDTFGNEDIYVPKMKNELKKINSEGLDREITEVTIKETLKAMNDILHIK